jgi:hypothetical protein
MGTQGQNLFGLAGRSICWPVGLSARCLSSVCLLSRLIYDCIHMTDSLASLLSSQSRYLSAAAWSTAAGLSTRDRLVRDLACLAERGSIATLCRALSTGVRRELCAQYVAGLQAHLAHLTDRPA